jgi:phosphatidate cytidylyltransferase
VLKARVLTALVLLGIFLPTMFFGPPELWGIASLIALSIAVYEWCKLVSPSKISAAVPIAALTAGMGMAWLLLVQAFPGQTLKGFLQVVCICLTLYWIVFGTRALATRKPAPGGVFIALIAGLVCWLALLELRRIGPLALLSCLMVVWLADIGAYFFGRAFGQRKLAPAISPGKSWEGAIGGAFVVVVVALICAAAPALSETLPAKIVGKWSGFGAAAFLLCLVALSVMGDLHESLLKRLAGVKDSGASLPGHGGFFDRVDALIPTMPAAYLLWSFSS